MDNQNTQAIERMVRLVAKTGLFFSCVDGEYADSERQFLRNYLEQLAKVGPVDEVKDMIEHAMDQPITFDEVVAETRELIAMFDSSFDKEMIEMSMFNFIDQIIKADGVEHPAEREYFIAWANAIDDDVIEHQNFLNQ